MIQEWNTEFQIAANLINEDREESIEKWSELIEKDMRILGATAIEDKLQGI